MKTRFWIVSVLLAALCGTPSPRAAVLGEDAPLYISKDKRVGTLRKGAQVEVTEDAGEWMRVTYETMDATFEGYVRKSALLLGDRGVSGPPAATPGAVTPPAPADGNPAGRNAPAPGPAPAPAQPVPPPPDRELALNSFWITGSKNMSQSTADFLGQFHDFGQARVKLRPDRAYTIYRKIEYLSPVADALKSLGATKVTVETLKTPGLPADSFTSHSLDGYFDGFGRATLVADRKGQVVAVQLSDRGDREAWLKNMWWNDKFNFKKRVEYSDRWRLVNLLEGRMKANSSWRVGYGFAQSDGVLRIDSELVTGQDWDSRSKERHRTYLPQPIVDILLEMASKRN